MQRLIGALALLFYQLALVPAVLAAEKPAAGAPAAIYRGAYFDIRYPAAFKPRPLDQPLARESSAASFASPDGDMEFYVFSPQWGGDAPGIALEPKAEVETDRKSAAGKSSGVAGKFTWFTIAARDKTYTRSYQQFVADDGSIHWVIGMKYKSAAALQRYRDDYAKFKGSLRQLAD